MIPANIPQEIEEAMKAYEPYRDHIRNGEIYDVPEEVSKAFYKAKEWAWSDVKCSPRERG